MTTHATHASSVFPPPLPEVTREERGPAKLASSVVQPHTSSQIHASSSSHLVTPNSYPLGLLFTAAYCCSMLCVCTQMILSSEAEKQAAINRADGEAKAIQARAQVRGGDRGQAHGKLHCRCCLLLPDCRGGSFPWWLWCCSLWWWSWWWRVGVASGVRGHPRQL